MPTERFPLSSLLNGIVCKDEKIVVWNEARPYSVRLSLAASLLAKTGSIWLHDSLVSLVI